MSALMKSPVADALREAGLSEDQVAAALAAAAKVPVETAVQAMKRRVDALGVVGLAAVICREQDDKDWVRIVYAGHGTICFWPRSDSRSPSWHIEASTTNPEAAPSLMARAQALHDIYRQLVTQ